MKRSSIEAVLTDQGNKAGLTDWSRTNSLGGAAHERERLCAPSFRTERNDHAAVGCELLDERRRYFGPTSRHENRVVRRVGTPPQRAIADQNGDVAPPRRGVPPAR